MTWPTWLSSHLEAELDPASPTLEVHGQSDSPPRWVGEQAFSLMIDGATGPGFRMCANVSVKDLDNIPDQAYRNVVAHGVLAAVPREDLITVVLDLARLLQPGGRVVLTAPTDSPGLPIGKLVLLLESTGLMISKHRTCLDDSGTPTALLVAEKTDLQVSRGLERVQSILVRDVKVATYKLALIRAFCGIARNEPHIVRWGPGGVHVPLWSIARRWLMYYWPLFTGPAYVAQIRGESPECEKPVAFRKEIAALRNVYGPGGLQLLLDRLDTDPQTFRQPLRKIANTIRTGPVTYAGNGATPIFGFAGRDRSFEGQFGWVVVPESIWLDISRFHHWIEDSLILRWARLTAEMNPQMTEAEVLPYLLQAPQHPRDTGEIRSLVEQDRMHRRCVWTDVSLRNGFEVDHVIPYSAWGNNDLWNLLPAHPRVNGEKGAKVPSQQLLRERREAVVAYWQEYFEWAPVRFTRQVERSLGVGAGHPGWERAMFAGLQETVERVAAIHGLERWHP